MKKEKKNRMFHILDCILILGLSLFIILDTFVIEREYTAVNDDTSYTQLSSESSEQTSETAFAYAQDREEASEQEETASESSSEAVITDSSYEDENISINIEEYRYLDTTIYVADVQVSSAEYLKTAFAKAAYGKNVTASTSSIASSVDAILAINGDYYGARNSGYVLRNGVLYRDTQSSSSQEDLVIMPDGSFEIITEGSTGASQLEAMDALQVLSFGPALIVDGQIAVDENDEVGKAMASNPRTAICEIEPLHYLLVVSDGRTSESTGLSLHELAEFLKDMGVSTAYNLDGGGSSTMVFNDQVINNPTTNGHSIKERSVSDIVYIGY